MAVQSHFFSVGSVVTWAEAGVGAVATQSVVEPAYGPRGLGLMRDGSSAPAALHQLLADDPQEDSRQVAMIDRAGRAAVHTGTRFHPGEGVGIGRDDTIFATRPGTVQFAAGRRGRVISVEPVGE